MGSRGERGACGAVGPRRGAARRPSGAHPRAVRDPVFLQGPSRRVFRTRQAHRGAPGGGAFSRGRTRARRGAAGERLRACQQRLFQLGRDGRRRRRGAGELPQVAHSGGPGISREILLLARRHRLQGVPDPVREDRRRNLLGPVVSGGGALHGADGGRGPDVSDRDRFRTAGPAARFQQSLAAHDAGPCRGQRHAAGGIESHRRRGRRSLFHDLLRHPSSPPTPARRWPRPTGRAKRC